MNQDILQNNITQSNLDNISYDINHKPDGAFYLTQNDNSEKIPLTTQRV